MREGEKERILKNNNKYKRARLGFWREAKVRERERDNDVIANQVYVIKTHSLILIHADAYDWEGVNE